MDRYISRVGQEEYMKALSIRQPWAWLIATGFKDIENRTWPTDFRGRIYIHAPKRTDSNAFSQLMRRGLSLAAVLKLTRGAIIGEVDIIDCVKHSTSPWFVGPYGFVLANPALYKKPIPCKGRLGLFEPDITP
jgi:hypothetical protein